MSVTLKDNANADVVYTLQRDSSSAVQLAVTYTGPANTDVSRDALVVKSTDPKRVGISYGVRRSSVAYYKSYQIQNPQAANENKDLKLEISISLPIGGGATPGSGNISQAQYLEACARVQAFITSETYMANIGLLGLKPD